VADRRPIKLSRLLRKVLFVAPSVPILDLLVQMRQARTHIAMVVDEFGGIDGLATIEDLIEEIVGEIEDEHDDAEAAMLTMLDDGVWEADARIELEDLAQAVDRRLSSKEDEVDTLGGLVFLLAGHIPAKGECVTHPSGWKLEAVDSDPRRIIRVRLHAPGDGGDSH
jgi:CBS domain containing-hemolysin-like protein